MTRDGQETSTYLAFDYGTRSIGIAVGQTATGSASALSAAKVFRNGPDWDHIDHIVETWAPHAFVVGLPLDSQRQETEMSRQAGRFGAEIERRYRRPVNWVDETLSSDAARRVLANSRRLVSKSKARVDSTAAALILETYFDNKR